ncbi:hypothetical protein [Janthinobacterium sp.]|uniref:hypothetical protein n=1 Tax=Janthinobacterium sp. TaxID=1871054 RepID=UPI00289AECF0|nr:hypothetical protein [Janthinobacterium sp.]
MADKFYDGMPNVNDKLNEMDRAFAAGPYNALPLTGGTLGGPLYSNSNISITGAVFAAGGLVAGTGTDYHSSLGTPSSSTATVGVPMEVLSIGVPGIGGVSFPGRYVWSTASGIGSLYASGYTLSLRAYDSGTKANGPVLMQISGNGLTALPGQTLVGPAPAYAVTAGGHAIYRDTPISGTILYLGRTDEGGQPSVGVLAAATSNWAAPLAVLYAGASQQGRSINAGGTINSGGADYAEYMVKSPACNAVTPGQLIGIDVLGQLTDHWDHAIAFAVKSTDPCMVGGDSWARHLGNRPDPVERILPTETVPGESDEEWAARQAPGLAFDAALETARQTVDRIAFSGQVPCNVQGANPGQYIVPVQAGDGIVGVAVSEDDLTFKQYLRAIGKVIAIEDDGRARIIVKVA